ncbi:hypothetical protein ACQ4PT_047376 [Festuca glaucescens]
MGVAPVVLAAVLAMAAVVSASPAEGIQPLSKIAIHKATVNLRGSAYVRATPALLGDELPLASLIIKLATLSVRQLLGELPGLGQGHHPVPAHQPALRLLLRPLLRRPRKPDAGGSVEAGGVQEPQGAGVPAAGAGQDPRRDDRDLDQRLRHQRGLPVCGVGRGHLRQRQPHAHARRDANLQPRQHVRRASADGWVERPGFIHTAFMRDLWPNKEYFYKIGHELLNGTVVWGKSYTFKAPPTPGQNSLQRIIVFGDMGKAERDGSNEFSNYQPGSLNTTDTLIEDLDNYDIVFHIGDMPYANGYLSQWDQFTAQVAPISAKKPYMIASGNHERDWPNTGGFFDVKDSGGECGVPAETMYYYPAENRANFWYKVDYGLFRFCVADSEHDWREGTPQYKFIEECLSTVDRKHQPWLIFTAHRVLGYSSNLWYADQGSFEEPAEAVAAVPRRHSLLRPRPQLRAHLPALPEPVRQQRAEPLLGHHERDHLRRGRRRWQPPLGLHHGDPQVERVQGPRLRVHQAHRLQPLVPAVRVQEEQRRQGLRLVHHPQGLPRRAQLRARQLLPHHPRHLTTESVVD